MTGDAPAVWRFALDFYGRDGVSPACLTFQDGADADIPLLLVLLHFACDCRAVPEAGIEGMEAMVRPWREAVILPLRRIRRGVKGMFPDYGEFEVLRRAINANEIEAERQEMLKLAEAGVPVLETGSPVEAASASLAAYCGRLGVSPEQSADLLRLFEEYLLERDESASQTG